MSESIAYQKRKRAGKRTGAPFNGAVKSKNELYFQMASLFKEASKGRKNLPGQWMAQILKTQRPNSPGNIFMDNL